MAPELFGGSVNDTFLMRFSLWFLPPNLITFSCFFDSVFHCFSCLQRYLENAVSIRISNENARSTKEEINEIPSKIHWKNALEKAIEKASKNDRKWSPIGTTEFIIIHVFHERAQCFVGSPFFTAFVENAFSFPWAMKTSTSGPPIFTPISMKFLLGPLGGPRASQDDF